METDNKWHVGTRNGRSINLIVCYDKSLYNDTVIASVFGIANNISFEKANAFDKVGLDNAFRIVDCVNNCAGIKPEAVPKMLEALRRIATHQVRADRRHRGMVDMSEIKDLQKIASIAIGQAKE